MSSNCVDATVTAKSTAPVTAKDQRLNIDGLSLKKLDALQDIVIKRLGGGGFGDWWIEGHKTSTDTRHHALQEVFQLKRAIEDLNTTLLQQGRAPQLLDREIKANSKAAIVMNAKTREMIEGLVDKRMEEKMRDVGLKMGRTMDEVRAASQKENKDLRETIKSLEVKNKKNCDAVATSNSQEIRAVKKCIEELKRQAGEAQAAADDRPNSLIDSVVLIEQKVVATEQSQAILKDSVSCAEQKILAMEQTQAVHHKLANGCRRHADRVDGELDALRGELKSTQQDLVLAQRFADWVYDLIQLHLDYTNRVFRAIRRRLDFSWPTRPLYPDQDDAKYEQEYPDVE